MKSGYLERLVLKNFINNSGIDIIFSMAGPRIEAVNKVDDQAGSPYQERSTPVTRNAAAVIKRRHQNTRGAKIISRMDQQERNAEQSKIANDRKEQAKKVFSTKKVNYKKMTSVRIDKRTTIVIDKSKDPAQAKQLFLFHNDFNNSL